MSFSHGLQRGSTSQTHPQGPESPHPEKSQSAPMLQTVRRRPPPSILAHSQIAWSSQKSRQVGNCDPLLATGVQAITTTAAITTAIIKEVKYLLFSNLL